MQLIKKPWAVCLISAAMLGGFGVSAQAITEPDTSTSTDSEISPSRSFTTDLAKASLAKEGVAEPTPEQLAAAETSIQAQRDSGMGWGQIANGMGLSLGAIVSAANRAEPATQNAANKSEKSGQVGQSATASSRSGTRAGNPGGKGGGGNGGGNGGGGNGGGGGRGK
ncbi:MAG: hypothetical protein Q7U13_05540 [Rhodoferax sp.]|nr:hypothetical protein [Rhodoferax sp.]